MDDVTAELLARWYALDDDGRESLLAAARGLTGQQVR